MLKRESVIHQKGGAASHYVDLSSDAPTLALRGENPAAASKTTLTADGADEVVISNIPNPSTVVITGPVRITQKVTDGQVEFSTNADGTYTLIIQSFPVRDARIVLEAI